MRCGDEGAVADELPLHHPQASEGGMNVAGYSPPLKLHHLHSACVEMLRRCWQRRDVEGSVVCGDRELAEASSRWVGMKRLHQHWGCSSLRSAPDRMQGVGHSLGKRLPFGLDPGSRNKMPKNLRTGKNSLCYA